MSAKSETQSGGGVDLLKWLIAISILIIGMAGFHYYSEESHLLRVIGMLTAAGLAVFTASQTIKGKSAWLFIKGARAEIRKVVWPTRKETVQTTLIVMAVVIVLSLFLWLVDMFLAWAIQFVIGGS